MTVDSALLASEILTYYKEHQVEIQSHSVFKASDKPFTFELLCGDMSYKRFYRITASNQTFILVIIPTKGDASIEIFNKDNKLHLCPAETFINTASELAEHLTHVSPVHALDKQAGLVLLSDHGNDLFEDYVNAHRSDTRALFASFEKIFLWLKQFQNLPNKVSKDFFGLQRSMEHDALLEELLEYIEFGVLGFEKQNLDSDSQVKLEQDYEALATQLSTQPQTLVHRDFQSKNIMIEENKFWVIDYQDLCYGPYTYDYASIIFDPYLNLPFPLQKELIHLSWEMNFQSEVSFERYEADILACAKQRLLKAAGRYAKHYCLKGKDTHMKYYQPALDKIKEL